MDGTPLTQRFAFEAVTCLFLGSPGGTQYDEKNIRRRVYDALNVLIAMEIISRSKKEILWHGLPSGHGNVVERTRAEKIGLNAQIDKQQNYLQVLQLMSCSICFQEELQPGAC